MRQLLRVLHIFDRQFVFDDFVIMKNETISQEVNHYLNPSLIRSPLPLPTFKCTDLWVTPKVNAEQASPQVHILQHTHTHTYT